MNEMILDPSGKPIGSTSTDQNGIKKTVMDASYRPLGFYDIKTNQTFDSSGRPVGAGDQTMRFLPKS